MKWGGRRQSGNMEDRRGMGGTGKVLAGGGLIGIVVLLLNMFGGETGQNIAPIIEQMQQKQPQTESRELTAQEKEEGEMVNAILVDTEDVWTKIFQENGMTYKKPNLVLFSGQVQTDCGGATSASGPFIVLLIKSVYGHDIFGELKNKLGAKGGDFAVAYVVAHEIGHHVQTLLGTSAKVRKAQQGMSEADANKLSVALELQADFYAGVWTHYNEEMNKFLEAGDIEEALSAAEAVGDDAIQSKMQGHVVPDSFTHGTSEQRMHWFTKGFKTGDINQGDTFKEIR